ncbi:MAG: hypothetical protein ACTSVV_13760 [Promethearchaeota archaeon]
MEIKFSKKELDLPKVEIQCHECGEIFLMYNQKYFCKKCNRIFEENEIRKKCAL